MPNEQTAWGVRAREDAPEPPAGSRPRARATPSRQPRRAALRSWECRPREHRTYLAQRTLLTRVIKVIGTVPTVRENAFPGGSGRRHYSWRTVGDDLRGACGGICEAVLARHGAETMLTWQGEIRLRGVQPLLPWQAETQLLGVQPLSARKDETQLQEVLALPSRQGEIRLRGMQRLPPW